MDPNQVEWLGGETHFRTKCNPSFHAPKPKEENEREKKLSAYLEYAATLSRDFTAAPSLSGVPGEQDRAKW